MKKPLALTLCMIFILCILCACTPITDKQGTTGKFSIVTTGFPTYDFIRQIAGEKLTSGTVSLKMLLPAGSEVHTYEPSAHDIAQIQACNLFVYVGGESDTWVEKILNSFDSSNIHTLKLIGSVPTLHEEHPADDVHEHEEHDEYDEHIWTSPKNALLIISAIGSAMCQLDSANADYYTQNVSAYSNTLTQLNTEFEQAVASSAKKTLIFADRFPLLYFTHAYGLKHFAAFPGCSEESEASVATVKKLIDKVRAENITVVFYIEFSSQKLADTICEATGAHKALFHSCHNVTKTEFDTGITYVQIMENNLKVLKEALG